MSGAIWYLVTLLTWSDGTIHKYVDMYDDAGSCLQAVEDSNARIAYCTTVEP